jgi:hypothetical protein
VSGLVIVFVTIKINGAPPLRGADRGNQGLCELQRCLPSQRGRGFFAIIVQRSKFPIFATGREIARLQRHRWSAGTRLECAGYYRPVTSQEFLR